MEGVEAFADEGEHGGELGEQKYASAFFEEGGDEFDKVVEFGGGPHFAGGFEGDEAGVAADLAEFEEGVEDDDLGALEAQAIDLLAHALFHGQADGFVEVALGGGEFDLADDFGFRGEFLGHLVLASAEEEGADAAGEFLTARLVLIAFDGVAEVGTEGAFITEEAWEEEAEEGPEFAEVIFHGGAGHAEPMASLEAGDHLGGVGAGVFDVLGFVEDDAVVGGFGEDFGVAAEEGVGGEDEFGVLEVLEVLVSLVAVEGESAEVGGEAGGFIEPIGEDGRGTDHQGGAIQAALFFFEEHVGESLDGFTQAHVVGEDTAEVEFAEELDPAEAVELVGAQFGAESEGWGEGSGLGGLAEAMGEGLEMGMGFPMPIGGLGKVAELDGAEAMDGDATGGVEGAGGVEFHQGGEDGAEAIDGEGDAASVGQGDQDFIIGLAAGEGLGIEGVEVLAQALEEDGEEVDFFVADADAEFEVEPVGAGMFIGMEVPAFGTEDGAFEARVGFDVPTGGLETGKGSMEELGQSRVALRIAGEGVIEVTALEGTEVMDGGFEAFLEEDVFESQFLLMIADGDVDGLAVESGDFRFGMGRWDGEVTVLKARSGDEEQEAIGADITEGVGGFPPLQAAGGEVEDGLEGGLFFPLHGHGFGEREGGSFFSTGEAGADGIDLEGFDGGSRDPGLQDGGCGLVFGRSADTEGRVDKPGRIEEEDVGGGGFDGEGGLEVAVVEAGPVQAQVAWGGWFQGVGFDSCIMATAGFEGGFEGEVTADAIEGEGILISVGMGTTGQGEAGDEGVFG